MEKKPNARQPRNRGQTQPNSQSSATPLLPSASSELKTKGSEGFNGNKNVKNGRQQEKFKPYQPAFQSNKRFQNFNNNNNNNNNPRRGFNRNGNSGFRNTVENEDWRGEVGSVSRPGSKKGGYNRIFTEGYGHNKPRHHYYHHDFYYHHRSRYTSTGTDFNKERFLQANCQFIVSDSFDYCSYLGNADQLVDWDQIEQLRILSEVDSSCPICLYPPKVGRMTRCGHIYCWPCILHYLSLSDKEWRKCPICFESIYKKQLRSVLTLPVPNVAQDKTIRLKLMKREKGTTHLLPVNQWFHHNGDIMRLGDECSQFSKLLKVDEEGVIEEILEKERKELQTLLQLEADQPESVFIREALNLLDEREEKLRMKQAEREVTSKLKTDCSLTEKEDFSKLACKERTVFLDAFEDEKIVVASAAELESKGEQKESEKDDLDIEQNEDKQKNETEAVASSFLQKNFSFFYQAEDGQAVYAHPINIRCLIHEYGSLENCPETVEGKILGVENHVMSEEVRERFRYLTHLPISTCFSLVELRLNKGTLSGKTLAHFSEEFTRRNQARQRKDRDERRRAEKAEQWEKACLLDPSNYALSKVPSCPVPEIPVITYVASAEEGIKASIEQTGSHPDSATTLQPSSSSMGAGTEEEGKGGELSFAQMLRMGKPKAQQPSFVSGSGRRESEREVEGGCAVGGGRKEEGDDEESLPAPAYTNTLGDVLQLALDNMKSEGKGAKKKKSKKGKGKNAPQQ